MNRISHKALCVLFVIFILLFFFTNRAFALGDPEKHFLVSFPFGYAADTYLYRHTDLKTPHRIFWATAIGTIPGLLKEIKDEFTTSYYTYFNKDDLAADAVGALAGAIVSSGINRVMHITIKRTHGESFLFCLTFPL
ncbi:MAG: hypothetical protein ACMUIP_07330 [bacterium]